MNSSSSARGQAEGLFTSPHSSPRTPTGNVIDREGLGRGHAARPRRRARSPRRVPAHGIRGAPARSPSAIASCTAGRSTRSPVRVDAAVVDALEKFVPLAPLHQPHNLAPIRALLRARDRDLPQVACFDTAFHRSQPAVAQAFALPQAITERGVLRYGFHGLSYEYIAQALPESTRAPPPARRSCCISATAPACARWTPAAAWRARWASPPSTACRWARAAATSIPA